jgi:hypothetical protein
MSKKSYSKDQSGISHKTNQNLERLTKLSERLNNIHVSVEYMIISIILNQRNITNMRKLKLD